MVRVAPFSGAWIEITTCRMLFVAYRVAPFSGAWIEIDNRQAMPAAGGVAPFSGAWIEIASSPGRLLFFSASLPSRERGLKSVFAYSFKTLKGRSLLGSVD